MINAFRRRLRARREEGTALITALLMTALMAIIAIELVDVTRFAVFRTAHIDQRDEAYWYARGARDFSENVLLRSGEADRDVMRPVEPWVAGPRTFPIEGGTLTGLVTDGNNCLNLNALAEAGSEAEGASTASGAERTRRMFSTLLDRLDVSPARIEPLKAQIIDWTDANTYREAGGAEDAAYRAYDPPLLTANQPMVELDELLVLPAMDAALLARLRPFVCVRPVAAQPRLNPNTMRLDQAVLLTALFEGRLSVGDAYAVLLQRPPTGYEDVSEFFAHALIAALEPDQDVLDAITLRSRWFDIDVSVQLGQTRFSLSQQSELTRGGEIVRHSVRFGAVQ